MSSNDETKPEEVIETEGDTSKTSNDQLPEVLTVDEAAGLLRMTRSSVYGAIRRKELPGVRRIGRSIRLHRDAVLQWFVSSQPSVSRSSRSSR